MEFAPWQKELMETLAQKGLLRDDILSVMMALPYENQGLCMLEYLKSREKITPDEVFEKAGKIAFGENA